MEIIPQMMLGQLVIPNLDPYLLAHTKIKSQMDSIDLVITKI